MPRSLHIFSLFTAAYFLSYFFRSANAVIAPDLARDLALDAAQLGLMTSLFFAAFAAVQLPLGWGLDYWGPRWVTPGLMLVGALGSLLFAIAPSFGLLALGRALIGVGMAGILMGALKAFSRWFEPHRFATVSGLLVGIGSSGALVAATPLAWLNQAIGWRAVFAGGALAIALCALALMLWVRNTPPGAAWPAGGAGRNGLRSVFADPRFWRIAPFNLFLTGGLLAFQGLWAGPYLFDVLGLGPVAAGNMLLLLGGGAIAGYVATGWMGDRFGLGRVVLTCGWLFALAQLLLALRPPLPVVAGSYVLLGFAGATNIVLLAHVRRIFAPTITGQVISAVNLFGIGGTFLLQWAMGLIIGQFPVDAAGRYPPAAHTAALALTLLGTLLTLLWYRPLARMPAPAGAAPTEPVAPARAE